MNTADILKQITTEMWARTSVNEFTVNDFMSLAALSNSLDSREEKDAFRAICDEKLAENKKSIAAMFLATTSGLHPVDDHYLLEILQDCQDAKNAELVEYIAKLVLTFDENSYALMTLANLYEVTNNDTEKVVIWDRLVRVDIYDHQTMEKLGDYYATKGKDLQRALNYYKQTANRMINPEDPKIAELKLLWEKIYNLKIGSPDYLIAQATHYATALMGTNDGLYFLKDILNKGICSIDQAIECLKNIVLIQRIPNHIDISALIAKYQEKYGANKRFNAILNHSMLNSENPTHENLTNAINTFETEIQFIEGAFVFHETWGIGRILNTDNDNIVINFPKKKDGPQHKMSSNLAYSKLRVLDKYHIWVLKSCLPAEKLNKKFQDDVIWGLKVLISSNKGHATLKEMKSELVPAIFTANEWTTWQNKAKEVLMNNENFGLSDNDVDSYIYCKFPMSYEEKKINQFRAEKDFYAKVRDTREYIKNGDLNDDAFLKMTQFFIQKAKVVNTTMDNLASWLFVDDMVKHNKIKTANVLTTSFEDFYSLIKDKVDKYFAQLLDSDIKRFFLIKLKDAEPKTWPQLYKVLFHEYQNSFIPEALIGAKKRDVYNDMLHRSVDFYKEDPDTLIYFVKNIQAEVPGNDFEKAGVSETKVMFAQLQLVNYLQACIANKNEVSKYKRLSDGMIATLFTQGQIKAFLKRNPDAETAKNTWYFIASNKYLDAKNKQNIHDYISSNYSEPAYIFNEKKVDTQDSALVIPTQILCLEESHSAKLKELDHITNVEIPENLRDIDEARQKGDLRENAEYQYGKDKQKNLNFMKAKLISQLNNSKVVKPEEVDTSMISFGTRVTLMDNKNNKELVYVILGEWEADPSKNIFNFAAPMPRELYFHKVNDVIEFELNGINHNYTVLSIEKAI